MDKKIEKAFDNLSVSQTEKLLDANMEMEISKKEADRIKNNVYKKIGLNSKNRKFSNIKLFHVVQAAAAIVIISAAVTGIVKLSDNQTNHSVNPSANINSQMPAQETPKEEIVNPVAGKYGNWTYLEYENHVVLIEYHINPSPISNVSNMAYTSANSKLNFRYLAEGSGDEDNSIVRIDIPDKINEKPVTDIAESCFISIRAQNADENCFDRAISLVVPENSPYFTIDLLKSKNNGAYALYNKDRTTLFYACAEGIKEYKIPNTVTKIFDGALINVGVPMVVEEGNQNFIIEDNMLLTADKKRLICCTNKLADVIRYKVPDQTVKMDAGAFYNIWAYPNGRLLDSPVYVELPEGLKEIPDGAFAHGWAVPVSIPKSVERIGSYGLAFHYNKSKLSFTIPENVKEIGKNAFHLSKVNITIDESNKWFVIENGVLYSKDSRE